MRNTLMFLSEKTVYIEFYVSDRWRFHSKIYKISGFLKNIKLCAVQIVNQFYYDLRNISLKKNTVK